MTEQKSVKKERKGLETPNDLKPKRFEPILRMLAARFAR